MYCFINPNISLIWTSSGPKLFGLVRFHCRCIGVVLRINFLHAVCVWLQDWGCVWMYGRSWVDYWALLCGVWASVQWRHHGPVWRHCHVSQQRYVYRGDQWLIFSKSINIHLTLIFRSLLESDQPAQDQSILCDTICHLRANEALTRSLKVQERAWFIFTQDNSNRYVHHECRHA